MIVHLLSLTHHGRSLWLVDVFDSKISSNITTLRKIGEGKRDFIEEHNNLKNTTSISSVILIHTTISIIHKEETNKVILILYKDSKLI